LPSGDPNDLFRSFEPEGDRVRYGLTTNIETFNPVHVAFHEYATLAQLEPRGEETRAIPRERHRRPTLPLACGIQRSRKA
jgi:hypothetical protein